MICFQLARQILQILINIAPPGHPFPHFYKVRACFEPLMQKSPTLIADGGLILGNRQGILESYHVYPLDPLPHPLLADARLRLEPNNWRTARRSLLVLGQLRPSTSCDLLHILKV
jgi:hypothetical protein